MFEIDETDPRWPAFRLWAERRRAGNYVRTTFSAREVAAADWLEIRTDWHHGYPQPADDFGYHELTYDLTESCGKCWVGHQKDALFRMSGEPKWGRRSIVQLNWVFDEYFVTPEVWTTVFEPRGIAARPVLNRRGKELATVVQLVIDE